jgi:uncharacterized membrane protein
LSNLVLFVWRLFNSQLLNSPIQTADLAPRANVSMISGVICPQCATEMPEISAFCPGCGRAVNSRQLSDTGGPISETADSAEATDRMLGAAAYLTVVPAVLFLVIPAIKIRRFARFHSWQSVLFTLAAGLLGFALKLVFTVLSILPVIGFLTAWLSLGLGSLAIAVLWAVLVAKAAQGHGYELPLIGPLAARLAE